MPPSTSSDQLFGEQLLRVLARQGPQGRQQLTSRAEVTRDEQTAIVRHRSRDLRRRPVHLADAVAEPVHLQPGSRPAERVGGEKPRPRLGVRRVRRADRVAVLEIPELTGRTVLKTRVLQQRAHATVEQDRSLRTQPRRQPVHRPSLLRYSAILSAGHSASSSEVTRSSTSTGVPSAVVQGVRSQPAR